MYCGNNVVVAEWKVMNAFMVPLHGHDTPGDSWVLLDLLCMHKNHTIKVFGFLVVSYFLFACVWSIVREAEINIFQ